MFPRWVKVSVMKENGFLLLDLLHSSRGTYELGSRCISLRPLSEWSSNSFPCGTAKVVQVAIHGAQFCLGDGGITKYCFSISSKTADISMFMGGWGKDIVHLYVGVSALSTGAFSLLLFHNLIMLP